MYSGIRVQPSCSWWLRRSLFESLRQPDPPAFWTRIPRTSHRGVIEQDDADVLTVWTFVVRPFEQCSRGESFVDVTELPLLLPNPTEYSVAPLPKLTATLMKTQQSPH